MSKFSELYTNTTSPTFAEVNSNKYCTYFKLLSLLLKAQIFKKIIIDDKEEYPFLSRLPEIDSEIRKAINLCLLIDTQEDDAEKYNTYLNIFKTILIQAGLIYELYTYGNENDDIIKLDKYLKDKNKFLEENPTKPLTKDEESKFHTLEETYKYLNRRIGHIDEEYNEFLAIIYLIYNKANKVSENFSSPTIKDFESDEDYLLNIIFNTLFNDNQTYSVNNDISIKNKYTYGGVTCRAYLEYSKSKFFPRDESLKPIYRLPMAAENEEIQESTKLKSELAELQTKYKQLEEKLTSPLESVPSNEIKQITEKYEREKDVLLQEIRKISQNRNNAYAARNGSAQLAVTAKRGTRSDKQKLTRLELELATERERADKFEAESIQRSLKNESNAGLSKRIESLQGMYDRQIAQIELQTIENKRLLEENQRISQNNSEYRKKNGDQARELVGLRAKLTKKDAELQAANTTLATTTETFTLKNSDLTKDLLDATDYIMRLEREKSNALASASALNLETKGILLKLENEKSQAEAQAAESKKNANSARLNAEEQIRIESDAAQKRIREAEAQTSEARETLLIAQETAEQARGASEQSSIQVKSAMEELVRLRKQVSNTEEEKERTIAQAKLKEIELNSALAIEINLKQTAEDARLAAEQANLSQIESFAHLKEMIEFDAQQRVTNATREKDAAEAALSNASAIIQKLQASETQALAYVEQTRRSLNNMTATTKSEREKIEQLARTQVANAELRATEAAELLLSANEEKNQIEGRIQKANIEKSEAEIALASAKKELEAAEKLSANAIKKVAYVEEEAAKAIAKARKEAEESIATAKQEAEEAILSAEANKSEIQRIAALNKTSANEKIYELTGLAEMAEIRKSAAESALAAAEEVAIKARQDAEEAIKNITTQSKQQTDEARRIAAEAVERATQANRGKSAAELALADAVRALDNAQRLEREAREEVARVQEKAVKDAEIARAAVESASREAENARALVVIAKKAAENATQLVKNTNFKSEIEKADAQRIADEAIAHSREADLEKVAADKRAESALLRAIAAEKSASTLYKQKTAAEKLAIQSNLNKAATEIRAQQAEQALREVDAARIQAEQALREAEQAHTEADAARIQAEEERQRATNISGASKLEKDNAEQRAREADERAQLAEQKANEADERAQLAEKRANEAEQRAKEAEEKKHESNIASTELELDKIIKNEETRQIVNTLSMETRQLKKEKEELENQKKILEFKLNSSLTKITFAESTAKKESELAIKYKKEIDELKPDIINLLRILARTKIKPIKIVTESPQLTKLHSLIGVYNNDLELKKYLETLDPSQSEDEELNQLITQLKKEIEHTNS